MEAKEQAARSIQKEQDIAISPKLWTKNFLSVCIMNLFVFGAYQMFQPTIPLYIYHLGGNDFMAGLSTSSFALTAIIAGPLAGWVLDHKGRRAITIIGVLGFAAVSLLYRFTAVIGVLLLLRMLHGFAFGMGAAANGTVAADIVPKEHFARGMSFFGVSASLATALAPAFGLWLIESYGFTQLFYGGFALTLFAVLAVMQIRFPKFKAAATKRTGLKGLFSRQAIAPSAVMMWCTITFAAVTTFVAAYGKSKNLPAGTFFTVMALATILSRVGISAWVDKGKGARVLYTGLILLFCSPMLLVLAQSAPLFAVSAVFFGAGIGFVMPSLQTMAVRTAPAHARGAATSTFYLAFDGGALIGGILSGWLAGQIGFDYMFLSMTLPVLAAALTYRCFCHTCRA